MRAVLLAAGKGERMWPLSATTPKPLLPVGAETLLGRLLRQASEAGCRRATVVVAEAKGAVATHAIDVGRRLGLAIDVVARPPRGTGDAVAAAGPFEAPTLVLNGDLFLDDGALTALARAPGELVVGVAPVADLAGLGAVEADAGRFRGVREKAATGPGLANAGVYRLPPAADAHLAALKPSPRGEYEVTDVLGALAAGDARVVELAGWMDVGWPWDLLTANERALAHLVPAVEGTVEAGATLKGAVRVEKGAVVKAGAYLEGPVLVRAGAEVGPNCYVRGATVIGERAKVGHACEVKNSVLFTHAKVPHLSYVGDSVLGADTNLGAGTVVANLRHDGASVHAWTPRGRVDTRRRKMGVVLGDGAKTGINATLNVGVLLGPAERVAPGEVVQRTRVSPGRAPP